MSVSAQELLQPASSAYMNAVKSAVNSIKVCIPCSVVSYNESNQTICARACITSTLSENIAQLPLLMDIPVYFPGGRSMAITYNINVGDDCLVIFADSCIDNWFIRGDVQNPVFDRKHDISDGFALVGFRPQPRSIPMDDKPFAVRMKVDGEWVSPLWIDNNGIVHANTGGD